MLGKWEQPWLRVGWNEPFNYFYVNGERAGITLAIPWDERFRGARVTLPRGERVDLEDPSWGCLPLGWPRVDRRETDGNVLLPSLTGMMFARMVHAFSFEEESLTGVGRG